MLPPAEDIVNWSDPHPDRGHCVPNLMRPRTMAIAILEPGMKPVKLRDEIRLFLELV